MVDQAELDKALDEGGLEELPPNIPPGFMGEIRPDFRKPEEFKPSLNAGIIQESTWETRWLVIVLLYCFVMTAPVAAYLLWRDRKIKLWAKVLASVIMVAGLAVLFFWVGH